MVVSVYLSSVDGVNQGPKSITAATFPKDRAAVIECRFSQTTLSPQPKHLSQSGWTLPWRALPNPSRQAVNSPKVTTGTSLSETESETRGSDGVRDSKCDTVHTLKSTAFVDLTMVSKNDEKASDPFTREDAAHRA